MHTAPELSAIFAISTAFLCDLSKPARIFTVTGKGHDKTVFSIIFPAKAGLFIRAEEIKGNADAQAAAIYAQAYNKDPEFYTFWKSMESYKNNLKDYPATLSTKMDYFDYLYNADGKR